MSGTQIGFFQLKKCEQQPGRMKEIGGLCTTADLKVGGEYYTPSGMGGVFLIKCTRLDNSEALFCSTSKDWPYKYRIDLQETDLSEEEFRDCMEIVRLYYGMGCPSLTGEQAILLSKGERWGWVSRMSHTQVHMTERAVKRVRKMLS